MATATETKRVFKPVFALQREDRGRKLFLVVIEYETDRVLTRIPVERGPRFAESLREAEHEARTKWNAR